MTDEEARRLIRVGKLDALLGADELTREMAAGRVFKVGRVAFLILELIHIPAYSFHRRCSVSDAWYALSLAQGWREAKIAFPPTFKFKLGTHLYLGEGTANGLGDPQDADEDDAAGKGSRSYWS